MKRTSTRTNAKPRKVYIKDKEKWSGKSIGLTLDRTNALIMAEGLVKAAQETNSIDVTIFPKAKTLQITVTYLK